MRQCQAPANARLPNNCGARPPRGDLMSVVVIVASRDVGLASSDVYALFGSGVSTSWLFNASCDAVRTGEPVALTLPIDASGGRPVEILGRIRACRPGHSIEIVHDQPWTGRLSVRMASTGRQSTRVTISAHLDQRGLQWVMKHRGWPSPPERDAHVHRLGLMMSKTGPAATYSVACEYLAQLAVDEINSEGGLNGKPVELVVADDATDTGRAAVEARYLVTMGCQVVIASVTSASFRASRRAIGSSGIPLIHPHVNEGGGSGGTVLRWGERPLHQVRAAANHVSSSAGGNRWFLVGNTYSWPTGALVAGRQAIIESGGQVAATRRLPLGTQDFSRIVDDVAASGADCVLSCLVGSDEVAFERQMYERGLRARTQTLSLTLDEATLERIGAQAAEGLWVALGYFQGLDNPENAALTASYRQRFGVHSPPISMFSESVYEAIVLYGSAVRSVNDASDRDGVIDYLMRAQSRLPRGDIRIFGPESLRQRMHVARASAGRLSVISG